MHIQRYIDIRKQPASFPFSAHLFKWPFQLRGDDDCTDRLHVHLLNGCCANYWVYNLPTDNAYTVCYTIACYIHIWRMRIAYLWRMNYREFPTFASTSTPRVPGMKARVNLEHEEPILDARLLMMFSVLITWDKHTRTVHWVPVTWPSTSNTRWYDGKCNFNIIFHHKITAVYYT